MEEIEIGTSRTKRSKVSCRSRLRNKLLDPAIYTQEEPIDEYEYLRNEELILPERQPVQRTLSSFMSRFSTKKIDFASKLALSVIKTQNEDDLMEVTALKRVEGFIVRQKSQDPRQRLLDGLRDQVNLRRTQDVTQEMIFNKSVSELQGAAQESDDDSSYEDESEESYQSTPLKQQGSQNNSLCADNDLSTQCTMNEANFFSQQKQSYKNLSKYFENEAQLGDEEKDDVILKVSDEEEEADEDLEELIDRGIVKNRKIQITRKHIGDQLVQDEQDLQKVINGEFKRQREYDFLDDFSDLTAKKQKLIDAKTQASKNSSKFQTPTKQSFEQQQDWQEVRINQRKRPSKIFRRNEPLLDETAMKFLEMIQKPETTYTKKSLIH